MGSELVSEVNGMRSLAVTVRLLIRDSQPNDTPEVQGWPALRKRFRASWPEKSTLAPQNEGRVWFLGQRMRVPSSHSHRNRTSTQRTWNMEQRTEADGCATGSNKARAAPPHCCFPTLYLHKNLLPPSIQSLLRLLPRVSRKPGYLTRVPRVPS